VPGHLSLLHAHLTLVDRAPGYRSQSGARIRAASQWDEPPGRKRRAKGDWKLALILPLAITTAATFDHMFISLQPLGLAIFLVRLSK
jgi:hypothetical protein